MSTFVCPRCSAPRFRIEASMDLGPGDYDDERSIQLARCDACNVRGVAFYAESRRGRGERVHHDVFVLDDRTRFEHAILGCADRQNARCPCVSHEAMRGAADTRQGLTSSSCMQVAR